LTRVERQNRSNSGRGKRVAGALVRPCFRGPPGEALEPVDCQYAAVRDRRPSENGERQKPRSFGAKPRSRSSPSVKHRRPSGGPARCASKALVLLKGMPQALQRQRSPRNSHPFTRTPALRYGRCGTCRPGAFRPVDGVGSRYTLGGMRATLRGVSVVRMWAGFAASQNAD